MNANSFYRQREEANRGALIWCGHCHAFHHGGVCPCRERIAALEEKVKTLRGRLTDLVTELEQARLGTREP